MSCCLTLTIEYRFKEIGLWYFLDIIDNRCGNGILFDGQQFDSAFEVNSQEEVFKQFLDFVKDAKAEELFEACVENPVPDF